MEGNVVSNSRNYFNFTPVKKRRTTLQLHFEK